ncbi:MAG TPA: ATP-binding protein [Solirubrobacteraceae bacterium]
MSEDVGSDLSASVPQRPIHHALLFEHNPFPMLVYDRATLRILAVSNAAVACWGYTREELLAMSLRDLSTEDDLAGLNGFMTSMAFEAPGMLTSMRRQRRKDGRIIEVDVTADDLDLGDRRCRIVLCQDVTERNRATAELEEAREQLRRSADQHRLLFERNPQPLLVYDCQSLRIVAVSDAAIASMGYTREDFMALTLLDIAPPEDHADMVAFGRRHAAGERVGLITARPRRHVTKDGSVLDVEVTSDELMLDGRLCRVCLTLDVTERNRASAELAIARDQAVEASNMKSAFLANMSHEIRTPMNGVIGMTELLLSMGLSDAQRECAEQIARSGEQMLSIINDILDISKIETGHLELEIVDFNLAEMVTQTCALARPQADAKALRLGLEIAPELPRRLCGDARRLNQIVLNLVTNAIKFTPEGSVTVRVTLPERHEEDGTAVRIAVSDTGIGIASDSLERMFESFTQADVSTTRLYGGTGLGLAIARELVELMGGSIRAESELGHGSTFSFELVLGHPLAAVAPAIASGAALTDEPLWATPPLVLVAEDSQINQIVAARSLERAGCRVEVVGDGRQALAALAARRFDVVMMDCQMPELDGYDATAELRRREAPGEHVPVIAMTAQAMDGDRERCLDAGMDDFISKPMRFEALRSMLLKWVDVEQSAAEAPHGDAEGALSAAEG